MNPSDPRRRRLWIGIGLIILLVIVSWTIVGIMDGMTHDPASEVTATPTIERNQTP